MVRIVLLSLGLILAQQVFSQCYDVDKIPNTKLVNNSYVSNPDGILTSSAVAQIDASLAQLEQATSVQVSVVAVRSICSGDIFSFAQDLFNSWGIGQREKDNGVLVLLVVDMREVRFHTGYGVEGVLTDALCKRIQVNEMLPSFRNNDYDAGVIGGINGIVKILSDPDYLEELRVEQQRDEEGWPAVIMLYYVFGFFAFLFAFVYHQSSRIFANSKRPKTGKFSKMRLPRWMWVTEFGLIPALIPLTIHFSPSESPSILLGISIYLYFMLTLIHKRIRMSELVAEYGDNYFKITELFRHFQTYWLVMGIIFPVPMLLHYIVYVMRKNHFRNHPRNCPKCGSPLKKLNEKDDDAHLKENQVFEEKLKSVDYDVWLCTNCIFVTKYTFPSRLTKYKRCPKCSTVAFYTKSRTTIVSPTYESSGRGEELKLCKFCNHSQVSSYTIAKLTRSSSSSSGGGSSGGGSWGGGSSGGGGASSSW